MAFFEKLKVFSPVDNELVTILQNVNCPTGSKVINDEFHDLFISMNGQLVGPLGAGRYDLNTNYSPFFTRIRNFPTGGIPPINVTIFFVSKQNFNQQWGTGEIVCSEKILKIPIPVRIAAGGSMLFKVTNSKLFLKNLVGLQGFNVDDLSSSTRALIIPKVRDAIVNRMESESFIGAQSNLAGISGSLMPPLAASLARYGISLTEFAVTCFNINQEDLAKIQSIHQSRVAKATDLEATANEIATIYNGNVYDRAKVEALLNFSKNQGEAGGMSQLAMFPILMSLGQQLSNQMGDVFDTTARTPRPAPAQCPNCHHTIPDRCRFCPDCGHQIN
ncbi:MAG: SPFH domain-containing protein [Clostridia bacterium]|nr:SPFH domain-containing protein [Clostridia bacterium]